MLKINKILGFFITVFLVFCLNFSPVFAGGGTFVGELLGAVPIVSDILDALYCPVGDDVLGLTDCNGGGGGALAWYGSGTSVVCTPNWTPTESTYCLGVSFPQEDGCGSTRISEGSLSCNVPPTATSLNVSVVSSSSYCGTNGAHIFNWVYSDSPVYSILNESFLYTPDNDESRFQFQVDNSSDFSSPQIDRDYTGLSVASGSANSQSAIVIVSPGFDQLGFNTYYYWRVRVYDSGGKDSGWVNGPAFSTAKHSFPSVSFSWSPVQIHTEEDIQFFDKSIVYGGAFKSVWSWTFENGEPSVSDEQNPIVTFLLKGINEITLSLTDSDNYTCTGTSGTENIESVNVKTKIPNWREILPW